MKGVLGSCVSSHRQKDLRNVFTDLKPKSREKGNSADLREKSDCLQDGQGFRTARNSALGGKEKTLKWERRDLLK